MRKFSAKIGVTALFALALFTLSISQASAQKFKDKAEGPVTLEVDCAAGESIQASVDQASDGDTITVVGGSTCLENIVVKVDHVTLDGNGTATIDGSGDPTSDTVRVLGTDVTIKGFTITGGRFGMSVGRSGSAVFEDNTITGASNHGVHVSQSSFALFIDNTITLNGGMGVFLRQASGANFINNDINTNGRNGIRVSKGSHADIQGGNTITFNGTARISAGIQADRQSAVDLSFDGVPNEMVSNSGNGLFCARSSSVIFEVPQIFGGGDGFFASDCDVSGDSGAP